MSSRSSGIVLVLVLVLVLENSLPLLRVFVRSLSRRDGMIVARQFIAWNASNRESVSAEADLILTPG